MSRADGAPSRQGEITRVAAQLFNARGFAGTSMQDIAAALGIQKPTLYHYVQSKAQVVSWIYRECVEAIHPALRSYFEQGLPPEEIIFRAARDILSLLRDKPGYLRVYFENHRDLDPDEQTFIIAERDDYFALVALAIERGQLAGLFEKREEPNIAALAFFGMCNWTYQWFSSSGPLTVDELAERFWDIFLNGIAVRGDSERVTLPPSARPAARP